MAQSSETYGSMSAGGWKPNQNVIQPSAPSSPQQKTYGSMTTGGWSATPIPQSVAPKITSSGGSSHSHKASAPPTTSTSTVPITAGQASQYAPPLQVGKVNPKQVIIERAGIVNPYTVNDVAYFPMSWLKEHNAYVGEFGANKGIIVPTGKGTYASAGYLFGTAVGIGSDVQVGTLTETTTTSSASEPLASFSTNAPYSVALATAPPKTQLGSETISGYMLNGKWNDGVKFGTVPIVPDYYSIAGIRGNDILSSKDWLTKGIYNAQPILYAPSAHNVVTAGIGALATGIFTISPAYAIPSLISNKTKYLSDLQSAGKIFNANYYSGIYKAGRQDVLAKQIELNSKYPNGAKSAGFWFESSKYVALSPSGQAVISFGTGGVVGKAMPYLQLSALNPTNAGIAKGLSVSGKIGLGLSAVGLGISRATISNEQFEGLVGSSVLNAGAGFIGFKTAYAQELSSPAYIARKNDAINDLMRTASYNVKPKPETFYLNKDTKRGYLGKEVEFSSSVETGSGTVKVKGLESIDLPIEQKGKTVLIGKGNEFVVGSVEYPKNNEILKQDFTGQSSLSFKLNSYGQAKVSYDLDNLGVEGLNLPNVYSDDVAKVGFGRFSSESKGNLILGNIEYTKELKMSGNVLFENIETYGKMSGGSYSTLSQSLDLKGNSMLNKFYYDLPDITGKVSTAPINLIGGNRLDFSSTGRVDVGSLKFEGYSSASLTRNPQTLSESISMPREVTTTFSKTIGGGLKTVGSGEITVTEYGSKANTAFFNPTFKGSVYSFSENTPTISGIDKIDELVFGRLGIPENYVRANYAGQSVIIKNEFIPATPTTSYFDTIKQPRATLPFDLAGSSSVVQQLSQNAPTSLKLNVVSSGVSSTANQMASVSSKAVLSNAVSGLVSSGASTPIFAFSTQSSSIASASKSSMFSSSSGTRTISSLIAGNKDELKTDEESIVGSSSKLSTLEISKQLQGQSSSIAQSYSTSSISKMATSTVSKQAQVSQMQQLQISPVASAVAIPIAVSMFSPNVPPPIFAIPKLSLDQVEQRKKRRNFLSFSPSFKPKYVSSVGAVLFNIRGKKPARRIYSMGLDTRPLIK